jgi:hypothetical protein
MPLFIVPFIIIPLLNTDFLVRRFPFELTEGYRLSSSDEKGSRTAVKFLEGAVIVVRKEMSVVWKWCAPFSYDSRSNNIL